MRDRSPIWIGIADFLLCCLGVVIVAVNPVKAKTDGVKPQAEFLVTADWSIERNTDLDLWVVGPSRKPVFYGSRQVDCADLDRDSLGFSTEMVTLADGTKVRGKAYTETTSIRCLESGHWDIAVNRFADHDYGSDQPIVAHVEVVGLNPAVRTLWAGDVTLKHVGETANAVSFELDKEGHVTLVPVPLESVTAAYEKAKAGATP